MAEKTKTKKLESEKEVRDSPVADIAQKKLEENSDAEKVNKKEIIKEIDKMEEDKENKEKERYNKHLDKEKDTLSWAPKTKLGKLVKEGKIKDIDEILDNNEKIMEAQIVDHLLDVKSDLISIGQSKGKFGGGKRRAWRQTQKKTKEGNIPSFSAMAVIGDENGHVGIGSGRAKETLPARDKAIRKAKLNIIKIKRACGGFDCACSEPHSIPFKVKGKQGSVEVTLIPAPQGTGLVVADELKKVLNLAGIEDIYSQTFGKKSTNFNLIKACVKALEKTNSK